MIGTLHSDEKNNIRLHALHRALIKTERGYTSNALTNIPYR